MKELFEGIIFWTTVIAGAAIAAATILMFSYIFIVLFG